MRFPAILAFVGAVAGLLWAMSTLGVVTDTAWAAGYIAGAMLAWASIGGVIGAVLWLLSWMVRTLLRLTHG
jgi:hypothetical protein